MDDMDGMDMGGTAVTMAPGEMMMMSGFHFAPYDQLWFDGWTPQTAGAMAGACVGLFLLAVIDRWIAAMRGLSEVWWKRRTDAILARRYGGSPAPLSPPAATTRSSEATSPIDEKKASSSEVDVEDCCTPGNELPVMAASAGGARYGRIPPPFPTRISAAGRFIPPFIFAHDIPRGVLQAAQAAMGYALMLAVMTFNAGYFLSILAGLGVGEILFGRYANHGGAHSMTGSS